MDDLDIYLQIEKHEALHAGLRHKYVWFNDIESLQTIKNCFNGVPDNEDEMWGGIYNKIKYMGWWGNIGWKGFDECYSFLKLK